MFVSVNGTLKCLNVFVFFMLLTSFHRLALILYQANDVFYSLNVTEIDEENVENMTLPVFDPLYLVRPCKISKCTLMTSKYYTLMFLKHHFEYFIGIIGLSAHAADLNCGLKMIKLSSICPLF